MPHLVKLLIAACTFPAASLLLPPSVQAAQPSAQADSITPSRVPPHVDAVPGTLLAHEPIETPIAGARAWKVRYVSADVNGVAHEVSGLVIAPEGPEKNRKVLTWCHGTTGLGDAACPSAQPSPACELIAYFEATATQQIDYGVPGLQGFVDDGYVVCATDYQGLGTPGQHQYLVNRTQARDAVSLVHAARMLNVGAGTRFGCAGWSQGGGAAAAVAELGAADYGELTLVGTVPMSPAAVEIAFTSGNGPAAALSDPSVAPDSHVVMLLAGTQIANHTALHLSDVFTPLGEEIINATWNTQPVHHLNDTIARLFRLKGPVLQRTPTNLDAWKAAITAGSAATRKPVAPVLLCIDGFGDGTVVPVTWQKAYAKKVEELGGRVQIRNYPHDDHFSLPASCVSDARRWLNDAF